MVRVITQETFDDVVKENMDEFEMSFEEAVKVGGIVEESSNNIRRPIVSNLIFGGVKGLVVVLADVYLK